VKASCVCTMQPQTQSSCSSSAAVQQAGVPYACCHCPCQQGARAPAVSDCLQEGWWCSSLPSQCTLFLRV
jgi:hypothetical protein